MGPASAAWFAEGRPFRLILTDANMPEVDGFDLAAKIKDAPEYKDILIMMLSSSGSLCVATFPLTSNGHPKPCDATPQE